MSARDIKLKRAYEAPAKADGRRILVDRVWPRGVSKADLALETWARDAAPSKELRQWFGHDPDKWDEFRRRYFGELEEKADALEPIREALAQGTVTLVYGARDERHNQAVALREFLLAEG